MAGLAPISPPPSGGGLRTLVVGAIGLVVLLAVSELVLAGIVGPYHSDPPKVTIGSITWSISYQGFTTGYFGAALQSGCGNCPWTVDAGRAFTETLTLTSSASFFDHSVTYVGVSSEFALQDVQPALPVSVSPGSTTFIDVTIQAPSGAGSYALTVYLDTS